MHMALTIPAETESLLRAEEARTGVPAVELLSQAVKAKFATAPNPPSDEELLRRAGAFRGALRGKGWTVGGESQIVPVVVGESALAVSLSKSLADRGILALPVRPPTVPEGSARLRFSLTAAHTDRQVAAVVEALGAP